MRNSPAALRVGSALIQPVTVAPLTWYQPPSVSTCPRLVSTVPWAAVPSTLDEVLGSARTFSPIGLRTVRSPLACPDGKVELLVGALVEEDR